MKNSYKYQKCSRVPALWSAIAPNALLYVTLAIVAGDPCWPNDILLDAISPTSPVRMKPGHRGRSRRPAALRCST